MHDFRGLNKSIFIKEDNMKYYTEKDIEKEIFKEIEILKNAAVEYDSQTYFNWFYPQIRECLSILVKFNNRSYEEIDNLFDRINEEIKSKIKRK